MSRASVKLLEQLNPRGAYCDLAHLLRLRFSARDLTLFSQRPARSLLAGALRTTRRGRGMDFEEVRIYQPGDDIRTIDWRVTARTQVTHTKIFREERERPVFMLVDQRASMFFGSQRCFKSVMATHISALLSWAALNNGDRIGGVVFGDHDHRDIRPRRNKHAVLELLQQLNAYNQRLDTPVAPADAVPLRKILTDARRIARPGCAVFIISDFHDFDEACEQQLFELARHTDVTLIHIYDVLEKELNATTHLTVSDGGEHCQLPAGDPRFQRAWRNRYVHQMQQLVNTCQRLRLPLLSYATNDDIQRLLRERFSHRKPSKH